MQCRMLDVTSWWYLSRHDQDFFDPAALTRNLRMKLESGVKTLKTGELSQLLDAVYARFTNMRNA